MDFNARLDLDDLLTEITTESSFIDAVREIAGEKIRENTPNLDDYVTNDDLFHQIATELEGWMVSMPDDPARRCPLGQAFTEAVEKVVRNSDGVHALVEMYVADVLDAKTAAEEEGTPSVEGDSTDEGTPGRFHTVEGVVRYALVAVADPDGVWTEANLPMYVATVLRRSAVGNHHFEVTPLASPEAVA